MASANDKIGGTPTLQYLDLSFKGIASRGGAMRFFFLQHDIHFIEELFDLGAWGKGIKQAQIASGDNPTGGLPLVVLGEQKLFQSHSTARYLSKKLGLYGKDPERDYQVDVLLEAAADWRTLWVSTVFGDDAGKAKYKDETRATKLAPLETLLARFGSKGAHAVGDTASYADAVIFAQLYDDENAFGPLPGAYPHIKAFYDAYHAIPQVKAWCDQSQAKLAK